MTGIPGRGWSSSPVVSGSKVFLTTEGKSKAPQTGTEYSNEYVAALMKQGLTKAQVLQKVTARDIELPSEVTLHYSFYCLDLTTGRVNWKKEFHNGRTAPLESFFTGSSGNRWEACFRVCDEPHLSRLRHKRFSGVARQSSDHPE